MGSSDPSNPYYVDFSAGTLFRGYEWYLNTLFAIQQHWGLYLAIAVLFVVFVVKYRHRLLGYFLLYVTITLLPVIFLPNHRQDFFWYLPFLGVSGFAAVIVKQLVDGVTQRVTQKTALIIAILTFPLICREVYFSEKRLSAQYRWYFDIVANDHRSFVQGLRALPSPPPQETLFFASMPTHFDSVVLTSATEVALRRTDIRAELVSTFPAGTSYRLKFEKGRLLLDGIQNAAARD
jgi:hypothetical protein